MTAPKTNWVEGEYFTPAAANVVGQAIVDLQNAAPQATAVSTNAAASKATPVDGDVLPLADSAASFGLKKLSWANLKLAIGLYYNSLTATLTNKTLASPTLTGSVQLNGIDVATTSGSQELSNKTISGASNTLANIPQSAVTSLTNDLAARQTTAQKGVANGYASLDGTGKLPTDQLPTLVSILSYRGTWNASTNSPTLANGTGTAGHTYRVDTAGTALGSTFAVGDYVIYTGSVWQKALSTDDATRNAVERTAVATLTNKTLTAPVLTSPTITGTPVADFARTRQVAGQGKFLPGTVVVPDPLGQGDGSTVVGLHNDLAHLIERGGTGTITQNGNSVDASGLSALFRGSGLNISASAVTDIFVIEVTRPATHPYGAFWQVFQTGINFRPGFVARSVKIEHRVSGVWSTSYNVTGDTEGVHYIKGGSAAPYVDAFRFTLTDFQGAGANLCRIQNIWSIGTTANPAFTSAATNFLPRSGGDLFGSTAAPPALQAAGGDANIDLDLRSKGTGVVEANGIPVVTTTGAQTVTNKTISGASNTVTNLPASATPSAARLVRTTGSTVAGQWTRVLTFAATATPFFRFHAMFSVSGFARGGAIVDVDMGTLAADQVNASVQILSRGITTVVADDSFKIVNNGYGQPFELWYKSANGGSIAYFYEISKMPDPLVTYDTSTTFTATEPTGTVLNTVSAGGVTVDGIPVVTTTGTQTLTNKTLTSPRVNQLLDTNGATSLALTARPSAVNYINVFNESAGTPPGLVMAGTDTDIGLDIATKGAGVVGIYAPAGQAVGTLAARGAGVNVSLNLVSKGAGVVQANGSPVGVRVSPPANSASTGTIGQWSTSSDQAWLYVCTATNTWRRAALSTW